MSDVSSVSSSSTMTATTGAGGGDKIRILGTNTGLDVDAIVKKMLKVDQTRIDNEDKSLQKLQWKQEAYQDIIASVKDLQNTYFNLANMSSLVTRGDNYNVYKATSGDNDIVTATASATAIEGNYTLKVLNTAKKATITGIALPNVTATTKLSDLGISTSDKLTIKVDDDTSYDVTFTASDETVAGYLKKVNEQTKGTVSGYFDEVSHKIILQRTDTGMSQKIQIAQSHMSDAFGLTGLVIADSNANSNKLSIQGTFNLNGTALNGVTSSTKLSDLGVTLSDKLTVGIVNSDGSIEDNDFSASSSDETLGTFLDKIKTKFNNKLMGYYDTNTNSINILKVGADTSTKVVIEYNASNDMAGKLNLNNVTTGGYDAQFDLTSPLGETSSLASQSNDIKVNGIKFTLAGKESIDGTINNAPSTTISVKPDIDTTFNLIKGFIDKYNDLVDKVQTKLTEQPDKDSTGRFQTYEPLTDAQKASMTADQIKNWEAKAKVGIIASDDTLTTMMDSLRECFFDKINDVSTSFGKDIGLDTVDEYKKGGRIEFIDDGGEEKLKDAITNNRNQIMELFTKESDSADKSEKYKSEGIFQRVNDILEDYVGKTGTYLNSGILTNLANNQDDHSTTGSGKGDTIPDQIYRENLYIKELTSKMSDDSEKYYNQFSKLEVAMEQLNSQSSWLSQMTSQ